MRKVILVVSLMIISMILMALSQSISIKDQEVRLHFDNVKLKTLEFYGSDEIKVEYSDTNVQVTKKGNDLYISSSGYSKVEVFLPESKNYIVEKNGAYCTFDKDKLHIETDDGETFTFENGEFTVISEDDNEKVVINSEGLFVDGDNETVSISGEGIIVEGEDDTNLSGFWGQMLGNFVKVVVRSSLSFLGDSPAKIVKHFVNEDDGIVDINWSEGDAFASKEISETFNPAKGDELNVSNLNGSVNISSWDKDYVDVHAVIKTWKGEDQLSKVEVQINQDRDWQIITKHLDKNVKASCDYSIQIPRQLKMKTIETTNGSIEISDVIGELNLRASNGSLEVENVVGSLDAFTSNGSIEAENISGKVNVTTSNGRIEVEKLPYLKNAITSNGSINAEIEELNNDILLSTNNANINVYITQKANADIFATTSNASINIQSLKISTDLLSKSRFEGVLGKGGHTLTASTSNASINFKKMEK